MINKLDKIDRKILALLQKNARTPLKHLAANVFLSSPAVSSRIERLENKGIITGYHASINESALDYHIKAFINLTLTPKEKDHFLEYIRQCENVTECHCITGHCSMLMKVIFQNTEELDQMINELQKYGTAETQIVFSSPIEPRGIPALDLEIQE
jgi:Lrp/AsnC family leucine-responsive transcriptional regulator